jgi:hypothetical protein
MVQDGLNLTIMMTAASSLYRFVSESLYEYNQTKYKKQVILQALKVWNLTMVSINSESMTKAKAVPASQDAFILNLEQHWFTLRRFGGSNDRWYNLNSMLASPEHISEGYLSLLLAQFESDGYSVFVVVGIESGNGGADLPISEADKIAFEQPTAPPKEITSRGYVLGGGKTDSDLDLQKAIALSLETDVNESFVNAEEMEVNTAILMSLNRSTNSTETEAERIRRIRLERFG